MATLSTDGLYTAATGEHTVGDIGVRPVGQATTSPTTMIQAIDALVTNTVARSKETANVQHDAAAAMERAAHLLGGVVDKAAAVQGVRLPPTAPKRGTSQRGEGLGTGVGVSSDVPGTPSSLPTKADVIPHSGIPDAGDPHPTPALPHTIEGWRNYHLSDVRQSAARSINERVSKWGTGAQQRYVTGNDANGQPIYATRAVPRGSPAEVGLGESPGARAEIVSGTKNFLGSMSEGGGVGESLGAAAPGLGALAGVAAGGYVLGNKGLDFAEKQRAANAQFQADLGGTNAEGFRERLGQNFFRLSQRGFLDGGDAERIYQNAAELYGVNKQARGNYQTSALNLYSQAGLSATESTRLLNTAAGAGNQDLLGFARAITEVGRAAREAGVGASEGRKYFEQAYQTTTSFAGQGAGTDIAQTITEQQLGLGEQVAAGTDLSAQNTEIQRRRQATSVGLSYATYSARLNDPNQAGMLSARGQQNLQQAAVSVGGAQVQEAALRYLRNQGVDPKSATQDDINEAAVYAQEQTQFDPRRAQGIIQAETGVPVDEKDAVSLLVRWGLTKGPVAIEREHEHSEGHLTGGAARTQASKALSGYPTSTKASPWEKLRDPGYWLTGKSPKGHGNWEAQIAAGISEQAKHGQYYGTSVDFLKNYGKLTDSNFKVQTKDGPRYVNSAELVKYYADQLQADPNSIEISGGENSGRKLGDVIGNTRKDHSVKVHTDKEYAPSGVGSKKGKKGASGEGTVRITASPALLKLVHINASGSAFVDSAGYGEPAPANNSIPSIELGGN